MPENTPKASGAFRTIGELSSETGLAPHILRYWETRFPQLRPLTRAGNRRYYRPQDVALVRRIDTLLNREGYTVRGVQQLLARSVPAAKTAIEPPAEAAPPPEAAPPAADLTQTLRAIRDLLAAALVEDLG